MIIFFKTLIKVIHLAFAMPSPLMFIVYIQLNSPPFRMVEVHCLHACLVKVNITLNYVRNNVNNTVFEEVETLVESYGNKL